MEEGFGALSPPKWLESGSLRLPVPASSPATPTASHLGSLDLEAQSTAYHVISKKRTLARWLD